MKNFEDLDTEGYAEIGEHVVNLLNLLCQTYFKHNCVHNVLARQLMDFEGTDGKRKRWLQAKISVTTNPLNFTQPDVTHLGYVPKTIGDEIAGTFGVMLYNVLNFCNERNISNQDADALIELLEKFVIEISSKIGDSEEQFNQNN